VPEDAPQRSSRRRRTSRNQRLGAALAVAVTVVGLLTQVTSLVDWVGKRFGDESPKAEAAKPPAVVDAAIVKVEPRGQSRLRDYQPLAGESPKGFSDKELDQKGRVYSARLRIRGGQGQRFGLNWFVVDANDTRLRGPYFNQKPATFVPRNQDQSRDYPVWIPPLPRGVYRVTFVLTDDHGQQVGDNRSGPFRVRAGRRSSP
jgi:hypothetical protein